MAELTKKGSILCQRCGKKRVERSCEACGWDSCLIRISVDGKYIRLYYGPDGKAFSYSFAVECLIKINREIKDGTFDIRNWQQAELEKRKFSHLWKEWIKQKEKKLEQGKFAPESLRTYRSYYRNHFTYFADIDVREIKLRDIQGFVDGLKVSEKYAKCLVVCLQAFFVWLERWDGTKKPLFPEMEITKGSKKKAITYENQVAAIDKIPGQHRDIFIFMRETALRVSEGCALKVKDIDFPNNRILIQRTYSGNVLSTHTKGRNALWLPMSAAAREVAEKAARNRFGEDFLFINPESGNGYRAASLRRYWNVYSGSEVCVHEGIRHSTISDWSRHANAFQVKELARHSDIKVSQQYVHNALTDLRDIVNRGTVTPLRSDADPIAAKGKK
ncbi:MAG: tyrosine-type recombinase/integrase [Smithella sp.]